MFFDAVNNQVVQDSEIQETFQEVLQVVTPQRARRPGGIHERLDNLPQWMGFALFRSIFDVRHWALLKNT